MPGQWDSRESFCPTYLCSSGGVRGQRTVATSKWRWKFSPGQHAPPWRTTQRQRDRVKGGLPPVVASHPRTGGNVSRQESGREAPDAKALVGSHDGVGNILFDGQPPTWEDEHSLQGSYDHVNHHASIPD